MNSALVTNHCVVIGLSALTLVLRSLNLGLRSDGKFISVSAC